jgi:hypothetical protein
VSSTHAPLALLEPHLDAPTLAWLVRAGASPDTAAFLEAFASAGRRLGTRPLPPPSGTCALGPQGPLAPPGGWPPEQLGRLALLLLVRGHLTPAAHQALLTACYRQGDTRERQAVLRVLPLLEAPERLLPLALDACRTHVLPLFEAIACESGYAAAHFPEEAFNQLVLKAVFLGVPLSRVVGLEERLNPQLARMARDYAREREAAGRPIPQDVSLLTSAPRATA